MVVWNPSRICMWKSWKENALCVVYPVMAQKKELQEILKDEIGGIQRVPAMIFFDQEKTTVDLGLG